MENALKKIYLLFSVLILGSLVFGAKRAFLSSLFTLQSVDLVTKGQETPWDNESLLQLAAIPVGKVNLFELDLKKIEERLLANDSIQEIQLEKRLPQTLAISIFFRRPQAMLQTVKGKLAYVDSEGKKFGSVDLLHGPDLPILSGFSEKKEKIRDALRFVMKWESSPLSRFASVSTLYWEADRGYRAVVTYPLGKKEKGNGHAEGYQHSRTMVELGQEIDAGSEPKLSRLLKVFRYLSENSITSHQVWADAGKKVVVKIPHGS